jgi:hypothetical protein
MWEAACDSEDVVHMQGAGFSIRIAGRVPDRVISLHFDRLMSDFYLHTSTYQGERRTNGPS